MASLNEWAYTQEEQELLDSEADLEQQIVLEEEIAGVVQRLKADEVHYDDLVRLKEKIIAQGGLDRATAEEAMMLIKDFNRNKPLNAYPTAVTEQYLETALEEIDFTIYAGIGALFVAILAFIAKFFSSSSDSSGGGIAARVQKSAKKTQNVVEIVRKLEKPSDFAKELANMMRDDIKLKVDDKEYVIKSPTDLDETILPDSFLVVPKKHDFESMASNKNFVKMARAYWFSKNGLAKNFDKLNSTLERDLEHLLKLLADTYEQFTEVENAADEAIAKMDAAGVKDETVVNDIQTGFKNNFKDEPQFFWIAGQARSKLDEILKSLGQSHDEQETEESIIVKYKEFATVETDDFNNIVKEYVKNPVQFVAVMLDTLQGSANAQSDYAVKASGIAETSQVMVDKVKQLLERNQNIMLEYENMHGHSNSSKEKKLKDKHLQGALVLNRQITADLKRMIIALAKLDSVCDAALVDYNGSLGYGYTQYTKLTQAFMSVKENKDKFADLKNIHDYFSEAAKELAKHK